MEKWKHRAMPSCHTCPPTLFSRKNILSLISLILSMIGNRWQFLISQWFNLNAIDSAICDLTGPWSSKVANCGMQASQKVVNLFVKRLQGLKTQMIFQNHGISGNRPEAMRWLRFLYVNIIFQYQKRKTDEHAPVLHLTQTQSARNELTKSNQFSPKLHMKQPEIT